MNSVYLFLFLKIELYCNIINVFTVTFGQSNASLLNKSIYLLKNIYWLVLQFTGL